MPWQPALFQRAKRVCWGESNLDFDLCGSSPSLENTASRAIDRPLLMPVSEPQIRVRLPPARVTLALSLGMQAGIKGAFDCIKPFSETDFTEDLKKINVPTLVAHGDDDLIVPFNASAKLSAKLAPKATLKV